MILKLNGFSINDDSTGNGVYLDEPVTGLGLPSIRTSSGNYAGRDGGWVGAQFYGARFISLPGRIFSQSTSQYEASRRAFQAAVAQPSISLDIRTRGGSRYLIPSARLDSLDLPVTRAAQNTQFSLMLLAPDPLIYDNSAGGVNTAAFTRSSGGGVAWPITWPITWSAGSAPTTVANSGDVPIYPLVTLTGAMSSPIVTNKTTGQFISLPGFNTSAGDVLAVDMLNRTVLLNGSSVLSYVAGTSSWWPLLVGSNSITLTTGNSSDTVTGTLQWRSAVRGI